MSPQRLRASSVWGERAFTGPSLAPCFPNHWESQYYDSLARASLGRFREETGNKDLFADSPINLKQLKIHLLYHFVNPNA